MMLRNEEYWIMFDQHQGVFYVDAQRNMAVTMGERDVKTDVKEKSRLLIKLLRVWSWWWPDWGETSICPPPCWRETLQSPTLRRWRGEGERRVKLCLQGQIEMRKMSNKGRWLLSLLEQVRPRVFLPRQRSLLSWQGCGAVWLWWSPGGQEQAGGRGPL